MSKGNPETHVCLWIESLQRWTTRPAKDGERCPECPPRKPVIQTHPTAEELTPQPLAIAALRGERNDE